MKKRSLLDELASIGQKRDIGKMIASRSDHIVASVRNLREFIRQNYNIEQAEELERILINCIRTGDSKKFRRNIERLDNQS